MKKLYFYTLLFGLIMLISCKDEHSPVLDLKSAATFTPFPESDFVFDNGNAGNKFPEIKWSAADYGVKAVVNYSVILTNDANAKSVVLGETGTTNLQFTNDEMNSLMAKTGAYPGQKYNFTISLTSQAFDMPLIPASNTITFTATPYNPRSVEWAYAYIAVGYPEWDYSKAYFIGDPDGDGNFSGYVHFEEDNTSFAVLDGSDITKVMAENQTIAQKGFYEVSVSADGQVSITGTPLVWGVIGDATSGGWDKDTQMEYDTDTRLWTVITPLLEKEFKFRANNDWGFNYGSASGNTNPLEGDLSAGGPNIKVEKASPYIITLNLTNAGKYSYTMEETTIELSSSFMTLPGSYQGWNPEGADCFRVESPARDFVYSGIFFFADNTEFKFWDAGTWIGREGAISWSPDLNTGSVALNNSGGDNILLEKGGYFRVVANMKKQVASFTKTGWEIIGDATPGGWDKGTLMNFDPATKKWNLTVTITDGEMKFRWDGSWTVNFGGSLGALTQDGANIKVSAGTYDITLDPDAKTAVMTKK